MKRINWITLTLLVTVLYHLQANAQGADKPRYQIETYRTGNYLGTINIELFPLIAPLATAYFDSLVSFQFYDTTAFHRVVPGFVIQGGDPNSRHGPKSTWGYGDPGQPNVNAEFSVVQHLRGRIGAARDTGINSANSQFYICVAPATFLDGNYTVYGQVTSGLDIVDSIVSSPRDGNDCPLQKIEMFVTYTGVNDSVPVAPLLISPSNNATGILPTTYFKWSPVPDAVMYTLELSIDSLFSNIALTINAGPDSVKIPTISNSNQYYWRVKANNGGHESTWSNVYSCSTGPGSPILVTPANASTNVIMNPVLSWNAVPNATSYSVEVYKSPVFIPTTLAFSQSGIIDTSVQTPVLLPTKKYFWRAQSSDSLSPGFYSTIYTFTTGSSVGINEPVEMTREMTIGRVYPNPTKSNLFVDLEVKQPGDVHISIKDVNGKLVYKKTEMTKDTNFKTDIDVHKFKKGIYLLTIGYHGLEESRKFEIF